MMIARGGKENFWMVWPRLYALETYWCRGLVPTRASLHDLILSDTPRWFSTLHSVCGAGVDVFDIRKAKRSSAILVTGELGYDSVSK